MKTMIKNISRGTAILLGFVTMFWHANQAYDYLTKPQLVYQEYLTKTPVFLNGVNVDYFVRTYKFKNTGRKPATNLHVELTVPNTVFPQCTVEMPKDALISKLPNGGVAMRSEMAMTFGWAGVFDGALQAAKSLTEFRNEKKEQIAILHLADREVLLANKFHLHPGQEGEMQVRRFGSAPEVSQLVFESEDTIGREVNEIGKLDRVLSSRYFTALLGLVIVVLGIPEGMLGAILP